MKKIEKGVSVMGPMDSSKSYINRKPSTLVVGMNGQPVVETGYSTDQ